jgi:hypothetical protein
MASLKIVPYQYVPTKRPAARNHSRSIIDTQTGAHPSLQESELGVSPEKALQLPIAETPRDARCSGAGEVSSYGSVQGMTTDQLARRGIQDPVSVARTRVSPGLYTADQHSLGVEADHTQVESVGRQNLTAGTKLRHKANQ